MSYRIEPIAPAARTKRPRVEKPRHLQRIRGLPCICCGARPVDAAHIRAPAIHLGKRETGKAEKPSDLWTLPLCRYHHEAQHTTSEANFWSYWKVDPHATALALWAADGDMQVMETIVRMARR